MRRVSSNVEARRGENAQAAEAGEEEDDLWFGWGACSVCLGVSIDRGVGCGMSEPVSLAACSKSPAKSAPAISYQ